jgi:hypothetical protein
VLYQLSYAPRRFDPRAVYRRAAENPLLDEVEHDDPDSLDGR